MKTWLIYMILLVQVLIPQTGQSQYANCPSIPEKYEWIEAEDYIQDREQIIRILRWLCSSPPGWQLKQRSLANAYVLEWLAGTPEFSLAVNSEIVPSLDKFPDLLNSMMHGMALYKLEHPDVKDNVKLHSEGLNVVAELAMQSKEMTSDKDIRKVIKAYKRHKIKAYVTSRLSNRTAK